VSACANAVKHANASLIQVSLGDRDAQVVVEVRDDGVGFEPGLRQ